MGMNPETNRLEELGVTDDTIKELLRKGNQKAAMAKLEALVEKSALVRPDGSPVPKHWSVFAVGEHVVVKNYTFKVAYFNETSILLEPVGPVVVGEQKA